MNLFRLYLVVTLLALVGYTVAVGSRHGWNLLPVFFGDMAALTWPGQFNADFLSYLMLGGIWIAWRHRFSAGGLMLGALAVFGGMMVLAPYLLYTGYAARGDVRVMLLGPERAVES